MSLRQARSIIKQYGTGYYRATFLFPKKTRHAIWTLYQFVRLPDEVVDAVEGDRKDEQLQEWQDAWNRAIEGTETGNTVVLDMMGLTKTYNIPHTHIQDFLSSMRTDLSKNRYATYRELETYMHGSASVIGYIVSAIIGYKEGALVHAKALAEAFQMTNFLRDIKEDYMERGRIYIPEEDMNRFGVTEKHIREGVADDAWRELMSYEIARTRALYEKGVAGIPLLDPKGRKAVYAAALIYKKILDLIEAKGYDIFSERVVVSPLQKTLLLWKAVWKRNQ